LTDKKAAPAQEQPSNQSPNSTADPTAEQQALEAIRRGLGMSGIEHDDWDFIGNKVLDSLKKAGIVKPQPEGAYFILPKGEAGDAVNSIYVCRDGERPRLVPADELYKPALEDIVRTIEPEASTQRFLSVYYPWPHRRTLAEAQRVAAALVAEYGGSVETMRFSKSPKEGCVKVTACGTEISIYFEDKGVSQ
jgi:hypothetical protein